MVDLLLKGRKAKYVHLLDVNLPNCPLMITQAIVHAEGKAIKESQTLVANLILSKREHVFTQFHELKRKA